MAKLFSGWHPLCRRLSPSSNLEQMFNLNIFHFWCGRTPTPSHISIATCRPVFVRFWARHAVRVSESLSVSVCLPPVGCVCGIICVYFIEQWVTCDSENMNFTDGSLKCSIFWNGESKYSPDKSKHTAGGNVIENRLRQWPLFIRCYFNETFQLQQLKNFRHFGWVFGDGSTSWPRGMGEIEICPLDERAY